MVNSKRGWIRILEATIAVMLIVGVLSIVYTQHTPPDGQVNLLKNLQEKILKEISSKDNLRSLVLFNQTEQIISAIEYNIPAHVDFHLRICDIDASACDLTGEQYIRSASKEVLAGGTIISSNIEVYEPKLVKLFLWYK